MKAHAAFSAPRQCNAMQAWSAGILGRKSRRRGRAAAADAERHVEAERAGGHRLDVHRLHICRAADRALPKLRSIWESAASRAFDCPWTILRRDEALHHRSVLLGRDYRLTTDARTADVLRTRKKGKGVVVSLSVTIGSAQSRHLRAVLKKTGHFVHRLCEPIPRINRYSLQRSSE